ncbi:MAG: hypothetical protein AAGI01_02805, partial [Myxococcota bacterium]
CAGGPVAPAFLVEEVSPIKAVSNALVAGAGRLWIVESGENTVSTFAPDERVLFDEFVDVGDNQNPYDVFVDEQRRRVYVTNYLGNSLSVADMDTGLVQEVVEDSSFDLPAGVAASGRWIYVTNTAFRRTGLFAPGSVLALDRDTLEVVSTLPTQAVNPQFATVVEGADGLEWVAIVSSGTIAPNDAGTFVPTTPGALELWRPGEEEPVAERLVFELGLPSAGEDPRTGFPGRVTQTPDRSKLYIPSGTGPVLFVFDMNAREWVHDVASPLVFNASIEGSALHHASMGDDGLLYITSFNDERLYLWDTRCDALLGPSILLDREMDLNAGPHGVVPWGAGAERAAYFIMTLGNRIGRVRLDFSR